MNKIMFTTLSIGLVVCLSFLPLIHGEIEKEGLSEKCMVNEGTFLQNFGDYTYYNVSLVMISSLYVVLHYDEDFFILEDAGRLFFPFGLFIVSNESGIQHFSLYGGWLNSKVWIYGHEGFIKKDGLWTIIIGECNEIIIKTYR